MEVENNGAVALQWNIVGEVLQGFLSEAIPAGYSIQASPIPDNGFALSLLGLGPLNGDEVDVYEPAAQSYQYSNGWSPTNPVGLSGKAFWLYTSQRTAQRTFSVWP